MSAERDAAAIAAHPAIAFLIALRDTGEWSFWITPDMGAVQGRRDWPGGWADMIDVRDADDVLVMRTGVAGPHDEPVRVWHYEGGVADALGRLLDLPDPGMRFAPTLAEARNPAPRGLVIRTPTGG